MEMSRILTGVSILITFTLLVSSVSAHNITRILAANPEFSTFNHYLTITHLAQEINRRETITVCAVDNAGMSELLSKQLSLSAIKNVLSLHILLDYFGTKKLHQITNGTALSATMFQATGYAPGSSGFVNITDLKGGKVGFGAEDNDGTLDASLIDLENEEEDKESMFSKREGRLRNGSIHRRSRSLSPLRNSQSQWHQQEEQEEEDKHTRSIEEDVEEESATTTPSDSASTSNFIFTCEKVREKREKWSRVKQ